MTADSIRQWKLLLWPRFAAVRNRTQRLDRRGRLGMWFLMGLGGLFTTAIAVFFWRVLTYFLSMPDFGTILTYKLLGMILLTFFSILLFSNIVAALSTFFLSKELDRLVSAPIPPTVFFAARFTDTMIESSWMILAFTIPAFLAYGIAHGAGVSFYMMTALTLPPFIVIPAAIGIAITATLVNVFPAKRARDILILLSLVALAILYTSLRVLQPERLVKPEGFADFIQYLTAMRTPTTPWLPSTWVAEILHPLATGEASAGALFYFALLWTTAASLTILCERLLSRVFLGGWSKAQEGRKARITQQALWERLFRALLLPFPAKMRLLMLKEIKTFFRDTSQWSQLILLAALIVVYVYNFSVLPMQGSPLATFYFRNVISFLNLALASFVVSSVAVRFVFPAISLEGKSFWIAKTAPMPLSLLWWSKFWVALIPLVVLGQILIIATNYYLNVLPQMMLLSTATLFLMTIAIVALGLAVGATYPKFDADNANKVAAGVGGLIFMILCMSFIGIVVTLEAWPVYVFFTSRLPDATTSSTEISWAVASLVAALILTVGVFVVSTRTGLQRLSELQP